MRMTWLGWAGAEIEHDGATVVIDALADARAVFAPLGERAKAMTPPAVTDARPGALAGLITHLHRDHADAGALSAALAEGAPVLEPAHGGGDAQENLALAQAEHELAASGLERRRLEPWESATAGPFVLTALPACDGIGDPQVSWLIEAGGRRILHLGDTVFHGWWWRIARRPRRSAASRVRASGAVLGFPHRHRPSPYPGALAPEQAAIAARILGAGLAIP